MENIGNIEMAYVAGMMDGDGSFSLIRRHEPGTKSPRVYPFIQLCNMSEKLIKRFHEWFGGSIGCTKNRKYKDGLTRQEVWYWKLSSPKACACFLLKVIPFLRIKKERAQFLDHFLATNPNVKGSVPVSSHIIAMRDAAAGKMREFNQRPCLEWRESPPDLVTQEEKWAYLAGLMDSDGSFAIRRSFVCGGMYPSHRLAISLTMYDTRAVKYFNDVFPKSKLIIINAKTCKSGIAFRVMIQKREDVIEFIEKVSPFLLVKNKQAGIMLSFCEGFIMGKRGRNNPLPFDEMSRRHNLYIQLLEANKHGVPKPSLIDLEGYTPSEHADRAEGDSHRERLSERAS